MFEEIRRAATAASAARGQRLAERLAESVLPLFMETEPGRPERIASCVLVQVDGRYCALTAGHALDDAGSSSFWASPGKRGKLTRLPCSVGFRDAPRSAVRDLDVGVLPFHASALGAFQQCTFLSGDDIDEQNQPDDHSFLALYFVLGYSASRKQAQVHHQARRIKQTSFQLSTSPPAADAYEREALEQADHLLLDFDRENTRVNGTTVRPPQLQGVSGGGLFHVLRRTERATLVGIATEHRRQSRFIVGTRITHHLAAIRHLIATQQALFE